MAPILDHLQRFYRGHLEGDLGEGAAQMLAYLRELPPADAAPILSTGPPEDTDPDRLALAVVRDVGEMAAMLLEGNDSERAISWSRANLIVDLEGYRSALDAG